MRTNMLFFCRSSVSPSTPEKGVLWKNISHSFAMFCAHPTSLGLVVKYSFSHLRTCLHYLDLTHTSTNIHTLQVSDLLPPHFSVPSFLLSKAAQELMQIGQGEDRTSVWHHSSISLSFWCPSQGFIQTFPSTYFQKWR